MAFYILEIIIKCKTIPVTCSKHLYTDEGAVCAAFRDSRVHGLDQTRPHQVFLLEQVDV